MRTLVLALSMLAIHASALADDTTLVFEGGDGPGAGQHIVFISGDEEYRSEEALPQLARILATRHGFKCTVLFAINPNSGQIDPNYVRNIPGLENLAAADLLVIFTRFRNLPDEQMKYIDDYLMSGRPVIGIRTATHGFKTSPDGPWAHYSDGYGGEKKEWTDGFGRFVLGEKWINHHGEHKHESTRGRIAPGAETHPVLRGIEDGSIWGPTDVYGVRLPLPGDSQPLILGEVVKRAGEYQDSDLLHGMRPEDSEPAAEKNDPMMPVAWTRTYTLPGGKTGRVFMTTMGSSTDFLSESLRRLFVNGAYWCLGMEEHIPENGGEADLVGAYKPTQYGFHDSDYWKSRALTPQALK